MLQAIKIALDPSPAQERALISHAGAARFAFNAGLAHVTAQLEQRAAEKSYEIPEEILTPVDWSLYSLRKWWNSTKRTTAPWWAENSKEAYNSGLESLARGLKNWNESRRGVRKGPRVGFPRFKSRARARASFAYTTGSFGMVDSYGLNLPRVGRVHTFQRADVVPESARLMRMTISRGGGRWFAALTIERANTPITRRPRLEPVGVDLGISNLAVLSTGEVIPNPRHLNKAQARLRRLARAYSRTQRGSHGRSAVADRLARAHARVANLRADGLHKLTTRLASEHVTIVIEDLNVAGMLRNRHLARSIADASFAEFRRQLTYKTLSHGSTLVIADRFLPSSKTCSSCGTVKAKLSLSDRTFRCEHCDLILDRDHNAARNLAALTLVAGSGPETVNGGRADQKTHSGGQVAMKPQPRSQTASDADLQLATAAP